MAPAQTIEEALSIRENPSLATLALDALTTIDGDIRAIMDNPALPTCEAEAVGDAASVPADATWYIEGNGDGACL